MPFLTLLMCYQTSFDQQNIWFLTTLNVSNMTWVCVLNVCDIKLTIGCIAVISIQNFIREKAFGVAQLPPFSESTK